jgi:hypothetical protein
MELLVLFLVGILICIAISAYLWFTVPSENKENPISVEASPVPAPENKHKEKPVLHESWCFVGDDLSGRYCVKVPSDAACTSDRIFLTRGDCELISGSHLVAGISYNGYDFRPLSSMRFKDDDHLRNNAS